MTGRTMHARNSRLDTKNMIMTAMMMCMTMLMTFIIRIPIPASGGYIHLGDSMVFLSVLILGWKWGAAAAGIGSALADLLGGFAYYAPITLVVKAFMVVAVGVCIEQAIKKGFGKTGMRVMEVIGMTVGGFVMVWGYYAADGFLYGNWIAPLAFIPLNILQFVVGIVIATVLVSYLYKTPAGRNFAYYIGDK